MASQWSWTVSHEAYTSALQNAAACCAEIPALELQSFNLLTHYNVQGTPFLIPTSNFLGYPGLKNVCKGLQDRAIGTSLIPLPTLPCTCLSWCILTIHAAGKRGTVDETDQVSLQASSYSEPAWYIQVNLPRPHRQRTNLGTCWAEDAPQRVWYRWSGNRGNLKQVYRCGACVTYISIEKSDGGLSQDQKYYCKSNSALQSTKWSLRSRQALLMRARRQSSVLLGS